MFVILIPYARNEVRIKQCLPSQCCKKLITSLFFLSLLGGDVCFGEGGYRLYLNNFLYNFHPNKKPSAIPIPVLRYLEKRLKGKSEDNVVGL